jgi:hypothetical protein
MTAVLAGYRCNGRADEKIKAETRAVAASGYSMLVGPMCWTATRLMATLKAP